MDKIKPFGKTLSSEDICFVYDPYMHPKRPYWTITSFHIYAALTQLIYTRARAESITYSVYDNLIIEMTVIGFDGGENLATRFLITV